VQVSIGMWPSCGCALAPAADMDSKGGSCRCLDRLTDGRTDGHPTVTYRPCTACSVYNKQRSLPIFCDGVAIRYVLPVLQMTSRAHNGLYGGMSIPFQRMTLLRRRAQASAAARCYIVLIASCSRGRRVPRLDESITKGEPESETAKNHRLIYF